jgi:hypothetical protein
MYISSKLKVVYIHIPKTAGQTVTKYLEGIAPNEVYQGSLKHTPHLSANQIINLELRQKYPGGEYKDWFWFTTFRSPRERYESIIHYNMQSKDIPSNQKNEPGILSFLANRVVTQDRVKNEKGGPLRPQHYYFDTDQVDVKLVAIDGPNWFEKIENKFGMPWNRERVNVSAASQVDLDENIYNFFRAFWKFDWAIDDRIWSEIKHNGRDFNVRCIWHHD